MRDPNEPTGRVAKAVRRAGPTGGDRFPRRRKGNRRRICPLTPLLGQEVLLNVAEIGAKFSFSPNDGDAVSSKDFLPKFVAPEDAPERPTMEQRDPIVTDEDLKNMHKEVDNRTPPDPGFEFKLNDQDSERLWEELDIMSLEDSWPTRALDALKSLVVAYSDVFGFPGYRAEVYWSCTIFLALLRHS